MTYTCLIADDELPARELVESYAGQLPELEIIASCSNGLETIRAIRKHRADIIFLDIQMPQLKGTEVAALIKENLPVIVFTTAYKDYALEAFGLNAVDYLLKPFGFDRFVQAAEKAMDRVRAVKEQPADQNAPFMMVKAEHKLVRINHDEILYLEALREYVRIFTGESDTMTLSTMKNMEAVLPSHTFCRVHKSYIVALDKIRSVQGNQVEVGGIKLPIGRSYKSSLLARLNADNQT